MTYKEAKVYLDIVSKYGSVLGLDTIRGLLRELGNPQEELKFIHIAGTNGKGSVLAYTSTILSEAGYKTGRYVSPTVVSYLERIQVDGEWIQEAEFAELVEEVQKAIARMETGGEASPTIFEVETAIAFLYFRNQRCNLVVLETGLGGLLDATNIVVNTEVAVFTTVSRDHMTFLGDTLEEIAENKAGIMKKGCLVVTANQKPEVMDVLIKSAKQISCEIKCQDVNEAEIVEENWDGQVISYRGWQKLKIPLAGRHQVINAVTVLGTIEALREKGYHISDSAIRTGIEKTVWPGRFTCIGTNPLFIIDGAHNEDAVLRLRETVELYFTGKHLVLIMGVFRDKEYEKIARIMAPLADQIYTVNLPDMVRSLPAEDLRDALEPYCTQSKAVASLKDAVVESYKAVDKDGVILAFGSLSYLGKIMEIVRNIGEEE